METGTKISAFLHVGLIGFATFGVPWFDVEDSAPVQIADVSLISSDAFSAMTSVAPSPEVEFEITEPVVEPLPDVQPETAIAEPEVTPVLEPSQEVAILAPPTPSVPLAIDTSPSVAPVNTVEVDLSTSKRPSPRPADRVAPEAAAESEAPVGDLSEAAQMSEAETVTEAQPEQEATAPEEATTEIVTEADTPSGAPEISLRPPSRPARPQVAEVEKTDDDNLVEDELAAAIAQAVAEAQESQPQTLSGGEMQGLVLAVQQCWNVPSGVEYSPDLRVVLSIALSEDGNLARAPKLIEQSGTSTAKVQAVESAVRALIECAPYRLPPEKYEIWREMEVVFNPKDMVLR